MSRLIILYTFWPWTYFGHINFGPKHILAPSYFGPIIFWPHHFLVPNTFWPCNMRPGPKCEGAKCIRGQISMGTKCVWDQNMEGPKCVRGQNGMGPKCVWDQKVIGPKCVWGQKGMGPKCVLAKKGPKCEGAKMCLGPKMIWGQSVSCCYGAKMFGSKGVRPKLAGPNCEAAAK